MASWRVTVFLAAEDAVSCAFCEWREAAVFDWFLPGYIVPERRHHLPVTEHPRNPALRRTPDRQERGEHRREDAEPGDRGEAIHAVHHDLL